jgi:PAS domain S-box-containing protein
MLRFLEHLFGADFMPHVYCLRDPAVVALHAISDALIAAAYFAIPVSLILLVRRRRDLAFRWIYVLFGVFILGCGATHLFAVVTLWYPVYRLEGIVKLATGLVSAATAVLLIRLVPEAVALPGQERFTLQLRTANARLAELAAALDGTQSLVRAPNGEIRFWSRGAQALYGWSEEEAVGRNSHQLLATEFPRPLPEIEAELKERGVWVGELRHRCRDGAGVWVASHWSVQTSPEDSTSSVVEVNNDITAVKRAEAALRDSEAAAKSLLENASQGVLMVDDRGIIVNANLMLKGMFGYRQGELIGKSVDVLLPESLRPHHARHRENYIAQPRARLMGQGLDLVGRRKDGTEFPVEISLNCITAHGEGLVMAFVSDISARHQATKERETLVKSLENALAEKIVLLKEVHHRVKNNLAVIAGLLDMQAAALDDEQAATALAESERRVLSMALVHEQLYATDQLNSLDFAEYSEQLARELCVAFAVDSDRIDVTVEAEPVELGVHRAIPCGLILNELLTNALKYAFPGERSGRIRIRFARVNSGQLLLSCEDDGIGIAPDFDWRASRSLGLRIVNILAKQIDGALTLDRSVPGTKFDLHFRAAT